MLNMESAALKIIFLALFLEIILPKIFAAKMHHIPDQKQAAYASKLSSYEVVTPLKVTQSGSFVSNDLDHAHNGRAKRDLSQIFEDDNENFHVHYILPIEGRDHMLRLRRNRRFIAQSAVVERRFRSQDQPVPPLRHRKIESKIDFVKDKDRECHFRGDVHGHEQSSVAVSACYGLVGYVRTATRDYFIEPIKGHNRTIGDPHPHIIYRRSALPQKGSDRSSSMCGTKDSSSDKFLEETARELSHQDEVPKSEAKSRSKRSISLERNVEVMVAADKEMIDYYSNEDVNTYILTVMNMVHNVYRDASIGNAVNIIVVRIILLETPNFEEELSITHDADSSLQSFCKWQQKINPSEEDDPYHHDVAVLLTRHNICSQHSDRCSTLGLAEIAGMCQPHRSCNVNEDTGLQIAYTVAHEIGHNFGMNHDSLSNGCGTSFGISHHVMSPHLASDAIPITWSNCSRKEITYFLDRQWGSCLVDMPTDVNYTFPSLPPGAMYDSGHQCRLAYGPLASHCNEIELVCQTLWCKVNDRCVTRLDAAAEGTNCGKHKWCIHGECVTMGDLPAPIHGNWGAWSEWSSCSRTCGAGISVAVRECNNPFPANGGEYCTGDRRKYMICNSQICPNDNGISFRSRQCSHFDSLPYKGKNNTWKPVTLEQSPCQLNCKPDNEFYSVELKESVIDGTPCNPGTRDMCIHGVCKRVACDWTIEGKAQEDRCGLCHGDGTQCVTTRGSYNVSTAVGYAVVTTFPKGARNVRVDEKDDAANYLAVKDDRNGEFYLNGNWIIQWSGEYNTPGAMLYYKREIEKESIFIPGPIKRDLTLMLLFQTTNDGVGWEYTLPQENVTYIPVFAWRQSDWSICARTCGSGIETSIPQCMEQEAGLVEDKYCEAESRPEELVRACNTHSCPSWWWSGPWQPCPVTCGEGTRRRTVICVRFNGTSEHFGSVHLDSDCNKNGIKPQEEEPCPNTTPLSCPSDPSWDVGSWKELCKGDPCEFDHRIVKCLKSEGDCDAATKPIDVRQCSNVTCGTWKSTQWSQCSSSHGEGVQIRKTICVGGVSCVQSAEPHSVRECKGNSNWKDINNENVIWPSMEKLISEVENDSSNKTFEKIMDGTIKTGSTKYKIPAINVHQTDSKNISSNLTTSFTGAENNENSSINTNPKLHILDLNNETDDVNQTPVLFNLTTDEKSLLHAENSTDVKDNSIHSKTENLDNKNIVQKDKKPIEIFEKYSIYDHSTDLEQNKMERIVSNNTNKTETFPNNEAVNTGGASEVEKSAGDIITSYSDSSEMPEDYYEDYDSVGEFLNKTHVERSIGSVKDDVDVDHLEMIEMREVKRKYKKKGNKRRKKNRSKGKRFKIHIGQDALEFFNEVKDAAQDNNAVVDKDDVRKELYVYYKWALGDWSKCDSPCEGGTQARAVECYEMPKDVIVDPNTCPDQPPVNVQKCNTIACLNWTISEWSDCSVKCGNGSRSRDATCEIDDRCHPSHFPPLRQSCVMEPCVKWVEGIWSMCNKMCGKGYQIRYVKCVDSRTQEASKECTGNKPPHKRSCHLQKCVKRRHSQQRRCKDHLDTKLCRNLVHMCNKKFFSLRCCRTCHRRRRG